MMEVANVRAMEVTSSANSTKRIKLNSGELLQSSSSNDQLANPCRFVVNSPENSISQDTSGASDQIPASLYLSNQCEKDSSRSLDPKAENFGTDISISINDGFSRGKRSSSEICSEHSEVMESFNTKKKKPSSAANSGGAKMPSTVEIEEFFSEAEKYEQERFANKYNYDIVKDLPLEGRYQWVRIKP